MYAECACACARAVHAYTSTTIHCAHHRDPPSLTTCQQAARTLRISPFPHSTMLALTVASTEVVELLIFATVTESSRANSNVLLLQSSRPRPSNLLTSSFAPVSWTISSSFADGRSICRLTISLVEFDERIGGADVFLNDIFTTKEGGAQKRSENNYFHSQQKLKVLLFVASDKA